MRNIRAALIAVILATSTLPLAADPIPVAEPTKYVDEFLSTLFKRNPTDAADLLAKTIGQTNHKDELATALKLFDGKRLNFGKTVIDQEFNGALRQIVHYAYIDQLGFFYFRFNFKMSKDGWILANFNFKSETNELFPKDFVDR
jgi:hypothetical protein